MFSKETHIFFEKGNPFGTMRLFYVAYKKHIPFSIKGILFKEL